MVGRAIAHRHDAAHGSDGVHAEVEQLLRRFHLEVGCKGHRLLEELDDDRLQRQDTSSRAKWTLAKSRCPQVPKNCKRFTGAFFFFMSWRWFLELRPYCEGWYHGQPSSSVLCKADRRTWLFTVAFYRGLHKTPGRRRAKEEEIMLQEEGSKRRKLVVLHSTERVAASH